ncbi:MAG: hypothetical protein N3F62_01345, partial [Bacteroidia bacterium]|nr:hypothetical protein [Bacteroidia bacterium]
NIKVDSNEFFFCIHTAKKGLSPFLLQVKKYFYPLLFVNFEPLIRILNVLVDSRKVKSGKLKVKSRK